jgi:hypothetical protein
LANPNPQHVPTDGLGVAAYVQVTGTNLTSPSGGTTVHPGSSSTLINGQGVGATAGGVFPQAQYALTLSLSGAAPNFSTCQLTTVLKDVKNNTYSTSNSANIVYRSYNDPAAGSPAWYRPSNGTAGPATYNANVASVSSTGLITAISKGQAVIEVLFPTFDFVGSTVDPEPAQNFGNPIQAIYCQILVTVIT